MWSASFIQVNFSTISSIDGEEHVICIGRFHILLYQEDGQVIFNKIHRDLFGHKFSSSSKFHGVCIWCFVETFWKKSQLGFLKHFGAKFVRDPFKHKACVPGIVPVSHRFLNRSIFGCIFSFEPQRKSLLIKCWSRANILVLGVVFPLRNSIWNELNVFAVLGNDRSELLVIHRTRFGVQISNIRAASNQISHSFSCDIGPAQPN
mmetsp:Transcript_19555/g.27289  ORF Transcript_19555/g.27289 Transcript_19555/m.27289 type:complete len:205 (-) Transcript_19555:2090-2704(-)